MVRLTGLEPATSTSGAWRSIRAELQARAGSVREGKAGASGRVAVTVHLDDEVVAVPHRRPFARNADSENRIPPMQKRRHTKPCQSAEGRQGGRHAWLVSLVHRPIHRSF